MSFTRQPASGAGPWLTGAFRSRRPAPEAIPSLASPGRVQRILAIKIHDQLGDLLVATPALAALRSRYPAARITLVVRAFLAPLGTRIPDVDEVIVLPRVGAPDEALAFLRAIDRVRAIRPELCFVLNSVSRSKTADALAALSGAGVVVGRSVVGDGLIPELLPSGATRDAVYDLEPGIAPRSDHQTERVLDLVRWTGADADPRRLRLALPDAERVAARQRLDDAWRMARAASPQAGPAGSRVRWIGIHPGAANPDKCWPLDRFVTLALAIARAAAPGEERRLVVFDAPRERGRATAVHAGILVAGVEAAFIPAGPLKEFVGCAACLDLLVCNDSGVMHIAAALDVPTVSFHALGRPAEWAPRQEGAASFYADHAIGSIPVEPAIAASEKALSS
jgi:ADP-heptose:LPS heptosyltransferase